MTRINWEFLLLCGIAALTELSLAASRGSAEDVAAVAAARYAPSGMYLKDHSLIFTGEQWHLFAPLGKIGASWQNPGSEETAEQMVSTDLVNWQHLGTAVGASGIPGCFDKTMGGIAPDVSKYNGTYYMFYSGWSFPSKKPHLDLTGLGQSIGVATSPDFNRWEKPQEFAQNGLGVAGTDPTVVRDEPNRRWLMYTWTGDIRVYESEDLLHWSLVGTALTTADMGDVPHTGGWGESPFVMKNPLSGKWMIFLNYGYSVSDDPLKFPPVRPYAFESGWRQVVTPSGEWGDGTNEFAEDNGTGFAHQIIQSASTGQWYLTGIVGTDGHEQLKFTPIAWTADSIHLTD